MKRDNNFLKDRMNYLWETFFKDVPRTNQVNILFGRKARKRLGSIRQKMDNTDTKIMVNGHFRDKNIPLFVVDATIVHELCHYAHGFSSPLPRLSRYPHRGGIVDKEMFKRGLGPLLDKETSWLNKNWDNYLRSALK